MKFRIFKCNIIDLLEISQQLNKLKFATSHFVKLDILILTKQIVHYVTLVFAEFYTTNKIQIIYHGLDIINGQMPFIILKVTEHITLHNIVVTNC